MNDREYAFLKRMADRPGMYTGEAGVRGIRTFLGGFFAYRSEILRDSSPWNLDYHLQRWLFLRESASIAHAATITGWELLMRLWGDGEEACTQFRQFIGQARPDTDTRLQTADTVACHIYQIYAHYKYAASRPETDFSPQHSARYYPVSQDLQRALDAPPTTPQDLVPLVQRMISEPCTDLHIYLQYERYFLQARFLYRTGTGRWVDSAALAQRRGGYDQLVLLHGAAALAQGDACPHHTITLHCTGAGTEISCRESADHFDEIYNRGGAPGLCNQDPMHARYAALKAGITG